ncbi:hypothetical protein [Oceanispirochaeta sp.]|uniref:hypothetical protein n=1 Tax=Oceanispirochaeta sp. TaxID=2035350 RepID=UPI0026048937|nr:hypothetical protein [Oceanispirochaeta sp.]MDA3957294.1 hypothetical protein [Oceanispirochaeta sp.]
MKKIYPALLFLLISGCSQVDRSLTIYSDSSEVAELVNLFNQTQSLYEASFIYKPSGNKEMINPGQNDIIFENGLHGYMEKMKSLDDMRENIFVKSIYPEILKTGILETSLKLIPLSLDIPVVLSKEKQNGKKFITWKDLTLESKEFNILKEGSLIQSGFSPLWSDSFLSTYYHTRIHTLIGEMDDIDFNDFIRTGDELILWINDINGSIELDHGFSEKYRYIPDYRLIREGRTAFTVIPLSEWALLPDNISRELEIQPLIIDGGLQSLKILSVGIPLTAKNPEGAKVFLTWLLEEKTWEDYLLLTGRNRDDSFAFLGGISSSETLNTKILPKTYPWIEPYIPRTGEFDRQADLPPQWIFLWKDLLLPMIRESISNPLYDRDMGKEYEEWLLLHPDAWES